MKYWDQTKPVLLDKSIPNIMRVKEIKKEFYAEMKELNYY